MESGKFEPSYLSNLFQAEGCPSAGTEEEIVAKWTSASLYTGGADTVWSPADTMEPLTNNEQTVCAIETFFLAMTLFPEVQRKAQQEIDQVLGKGQLPKMVDRTRLPYVDAVVKEVLRWHPVAPMGIPHMSIEEDTWDGFRIPKGSLIMPNIWSVLQEMRVGGKRLTINRALTHDPETYDSPMSFNPERFIASDDSAPETDPHGIVFGFGRRICPGRFLADNTLYLSVAQSLAVFKIDKAEENGKYIDVNPQFQPGVISHPVPWRFNITPRTPTHEVLIKSVEVEHPWQNSDASDLKTAS